MFKYLFTAILVCIFAIGAFGQPMLKPLREFRAAWVATVDNIDFPTKKGLPEAEQKAELLEIVRMAESLKLNALIFQVRPQCDALYTSKLEPWSEFLTGSMGKPQAFDPLTFLIAEGHRRGILVHAWFNPYRAMHPAAKTVSAQHISKLRPDLVKSYGRYLWLDPSDPEVKEYSLKVVLDVVKRYDIDGVHFDDYFYPYPEKDAAGNPIDFPDDKNWNRYLQTAATFSTTAVHRIPLERDAWRRHHVNNFIESVRREIKRVKPHIMYGISPFGIWQPIPELGITGFNAYKELYADALKWLQDGTVDYLSPQLYWETARKSQSFPVLFDWWKQQNSKGRHLWAGIATYRIGSNANFVADEIIRQILVTRLANETRGSIQFSFKSLRNDMGGIQARLREKVFRHRALIPASPWIKTQKTLPPALTLKESEKLVEAKWREKGVVKAFWFVVYVKDKDGWSYTILPRTESGITLSAKRKIDKVLVTAVDRLGNESQILR